MDFPLDEGLLSIPRLSGAPTSQGSCEGHCWLKALPITGCLEAGKQWIYTQYVVVHIYS